MNGRLISTFVVGAAVGIAGVPAAAVTCYELIGRNDAVLLRDTRSPVDLSIAGGPAREALRSRGELLVIYDAETCMVVNRAAASGSRTFTTDEIVAGWRSLGNSGFGGTYGSTVAAESSGGIAAGAPTDVGRTPAAQGAAAAARGRY